MNRKKLLFTLCALLLSAALLAGGTLAWLSKSQSADGTYTALSDFEVEGILSFSADADGKDVAYNGERVLVSVSFDPNSPNYICNMKYAVRYTGISPALIRVRVLEQWIDVNSNEVLSMGFLKYTVKNGPGSAVTVSPQPDPAQADGHIYAAGPGADADALAEQGVWVDNRAEDYCYYYSVPVQPNYLSAQGAAGSPTDRTVGKGTVELTLFDQRKATEAENKLLTQGVDPASTRMDLLIEVEAVQPNRYREFWGISALPRPPEA